jgi:hypothetical protein
MKMTDNLKTLSAIAAFAFSVSFSLVGYAADPGDAKSPVSKANEGKSGTKEETKPVKTAKTKRTKEQAEADSKAINATNETKTKQP